MFFQRLQEFCRHSSGDAQHCLASPWVRSTDTGGYSLLGTSKQLCAPLGITLLAMASYLRRQKALSFGLGLATSGALYVHIRVRDRCLKNFLKELQRLKRAVCKER